MLAAVLATVAILFASALVAALVARSDRASLAIGAAGAVIACAIGVVASALGLVAERREALETTFSTALGPLHAGVDPLSAFFLVCVFLVSGLAAVYGVAYLRAHSGKRSLAPVVACFNLLVASMVVVVVARDAVVFLMGWEIMSIASFFLVTFESEREDVRRAGLTYLVASHAGVVFLFLLFVLLSQSTGRWDFGGWAIAGAPPAGLASACFVLSLVGFGSKAGFWPVHIWLPDAHPAAPSHVSAVMSGVMIKMGIYGLLRSLEFLGSPPFWWGGLLCGIGVVSGVLGVLHALAQHDLKRLLAYHSVENIGIIAMGLGLGLLGKSLDQPAVAFLGFAGGLLHVLNHGLFKGLLFQGAGSVVHATGTRELDRLGGLARTMPHTATTFLVGAVAICGLPPLCGFVSEWLIYVGAFRGAAAFGLAGKVVALFVIAGLALVGGLAAACFVKAFGIVFLGEPRTDAAARAHEAARPMTGAMWAGAGLCLAVGLGAVAAVHVIGPAAVWLAGLNVEPAAATGPLGAIVRVALILALVFVGLALLRKALLRNRTVGIGRTWGCGYAGPTARMQYTATSFAKPVLEPFSIVFQRAAHGKPVDGLFPQEARETEHLEDRAEHAFVPIFRGFAAGLARLGFLQRGSVQLYLVYVLATLVVLLAWQAATGGP